MGLLHCPKTIFSVIGHLVWRYKPSEAYICWFYAKIFQIRLQPGTTLTQTVKRGPNLNPNPNPNTMPCREGSYSTLQRDTDYTVHCASVHEGLHLGFSISIMHIAVQCTCLKVFSRTVLYFWFLSWISRCPGFVLDLKSSDLHWKKGIYHSRPTMYSSLGVDFWLNLTPVGLCPPQL